MSLSLGTPWFLLGLIPVGMTVIYLVRRRRFRMDPALMFSSTSLLSPLPTTVWVRLHWLPDALRIMALALFVVALARPQVPGEAGWDQTQGIDIVLAVDTSGSMRAADFQPRDRMAVAKRSIADFIRQRTSDRIGLVVFAGEAASWVPLTLDYRLMIDMLDEVEVGMLPDGTAIGSAVGTAVNRLRESSATSRVVILLTDGDNNAGNLSPRKAAELAQELNIKVYTILIGRGGPVPFPAGNDIFGRPVFQEVEVPTNPQLLKDIAKLTNGEAYEAKDSTELDHQLSSVLNALDRSRLESTITEPPKTELFPWVIALALLLLGLEWSLGFTRLRRFP
ncbi:MAG: VWA domain-containing protein [Myxococcales bacterium]|nr:VWA domain-containing protein [Myxococcales bacterium]